MAAPRSPLPVRIVGGLPPLVLREPDSEAGLHPGAPYFSVGALVLLALLFTLWAVVVARPALLPHTFLASPPGRADLRVDLSFPALTFVGDETTLDVSVINLSPAPVTGTLWLAFSESPVVHMAPGGGGELAFASLAPGARATAHVRFVAQAGGALTVTPRVQLEGGDPADLESRVVTVSNLPRMNSLRSWVLGAFAALFAGVVRPWLKHALRGWMPAD